MKAAKVIVACCFLVIAPLGFHGAEPEMPALNLEQAQPKAQPKKAAIKAVECRWLKGTIKLDGVINEIAWDDAEALDLRVPWENRKSKTTTTARLLWDRDFLYVCAEMEDHDLFADVQDPNGRLWDNDSFALFIKPSEQKLGYYQFQVSAATTPLELYFPSRGAGAHKRFASPQAQISFEGTVKLAGTLNDWTDKDKGWTVEARIPWTVFKATGGRPKPGDRWRFALCRYDYSVTLDRPELSTTAPLTGPDFHRYEEYQELLFVERK